MFPAATGIVVVVEAVVVVVVVVAVGTGSLGEEALTEDEEALKNIVSVGAPSVAPFAIRLVTDANDVVNPSFL